jgi:hypothetical protein
VKSALGIVLIAFGILAGASAAVNNQAEAKGLAPAERFGQAVGGALCSLTLVVAGAALVVSKPKHPAADKPRRAKSTKESGPIRFPCPGCGTRLRVARSRAGDEMQCPVCEQRTRVPARGVLRPKADDGSAPG